MIPPPKVKSLTRHCNVIPDKPTDGAQMYTSWTEKESFRVK